MLGNLMEKLGFQNKDIVIGAPIEGEVCSLNEVNDPVFSDKILGDGVAIKPAAGRVVAPVDGTVGA